MSRIFKYNPDPKVWDGHVEVEIPDYAERVSLRANFAKNGEDTEKLLSLARDVSLKHVKVCDLTHKKSKVRFTSLEDLDWFDESQGVYTAVGLAISKGPKLGNVLETT